MKKVFTFLCLSLAMIVASTSSIFAAEGKIEEMMKRTGYPKEAIVSEIEKYAKKKNISNDAAESILYDAVIASTSYEDDSISTYSSSGGTVALLNSHRSDLFYTPGGTGHVGLYSTSEKIVEAPGAGYVVTEKSAKNKKVEKKTRIGGVSSTKGGKSRVTANKQSNVVAFARSRLGRSYAYTLDNKTCTMNQDYNCSQLVWCSFKNGASLNVDASTDMFVTPSDIYHSDYVFYIKMV